jgi:hypothetical protein
MNEFPNEHRPPKTHAAEGTLEGNVRVPQAILGIAMFGLERVLDNEDPKKAIKDLIAPIPIDDPHLRERVRKAQAQHDLHNIPVKLHENNVRRVEIGGNAHMLTLLGRVFLAGKFVPVSEDHHYITEAGEWATPKERETVKQVLAKATPERVAFLKEMIQVATAVMRRPEIAAELLERKGLYKKRAGAKTEKEGEEYLLEAAKIALAVYMDVRGEVVAFALARAKTKDEAEMAEGFLTYFKDVAEMLD